jgi:hypothetical protein
LSCAIAEKELFRSLTEIDALAVLLELAEPPELDAEELAAGVELLLELLELQPAATSSAAAAAAAVSPARAVTEYNGVPRSFTQTCRERHVRDQIRISRPQLTELLAEMLGLPGETFPLTIS